MRTDAQRAYQREWMRKWRAQNHDRAREIQRNFYWRNPEKCKAKTKAWRIKNPHLVRAGHLRCNYGITIADVERLKRRQGGKCAVCRIKPAVHVDHDHHTKVIRGILCVGCNTAIGKLGDNAAGVRRALKYLEKTRCKTSPT